MERKDQYILVLSGWYPSHLEPLNGDFVKDQVSLIRNHGRRIDMVYADLNIAYIARRQMVQRLYTHQDDSGNRTTVVNGPTWPKNTSWGLKQWMKSYVGLIEHHIGLYGPPQLIHAHTYLGGAIAMLLSKKHDISYLITEHYTGWMTGEYRRSHLSLARSAYDNAAIITSVSTALDLSIQKLHGLTTTILPNFIDTTLFQPIEKPPTNTTTIIGVGDLIPRKQWDHLIEAIVIIQASLPQIRLKLVGDGPELMRLMNMVSALNLESIVTFTGVKSKKEVAATMQSSDVLVQCSHTETFGLTAIEALSCGLEVITYDNGGAEAYSHLPGIHQMNLVGPHPLAAVIINIITRSTSNLAHKLKVSEACAKEFSATAVIPQLLPIYDEIIKRE